MNTAHTSGKAMMATGRWTAAGLCLACLAPAVLGCGPVDEMVVEEWEEVEVSGGSDVVDEEENVAEATQALTSLGFSTFVGGTVVDWHHQPAVDPAGNVYVAGQTSIINTNNLEIFVAKYSPSGALLWTARFGGYSTEDVRDIAVDNAGCVYVLAKTYSYGPTQTILVAKLNAAGNALAYYSRFGGSGDDQPRGIAVDPAGNAYVTGDTSSVDFPATPGAMQQTRRADVDAFVTKLNASGSSLVYSTYLGGDGLDRAMDIAVDASGYAYVVGSTAPPQNGGFAFPTTVGAYQTIPSNPWYTSDVFVTELVPSGSAPYYSTLIGGSTTDSGFGIAVDSAYNAYVVGFSNSTNFPATPGAFRSVKSGLADAYDVFVTKVNEPGSAISYSTWLGSGGGTGGYFPSIAVSSSGKAYVTGATVTPSLPVTANALQKVYGGSTDGFLMELNVWGSAAAYATYLGGSAADSPYGVAVDGNGNAVVAGSTASPNFPVYLAAQPTYSGGGDGFVTKILGP